MNAYFLLYSYVFVNCSDREALLVHTEKGISKVTDNIHFVNLFRKIPLPTHYYMLRVPNELEADVSFMALLNELEAELFGEILYTTEENRPIQFSPQVKINNNTPLESEYLSSLNFDRSDFLAQAILDDIGTHILDNVLELSIYYSSLDRATSGAPETACDQYAFPVVRDGIKKIKELDRIFENEYAKLLKVNFIVGDLDEEDSAYLQECIRNYELRGKTYLYITAEKHPQLPSALTDLCEEVYVWHTGHASVGETRKENETNYFLAQNEEELLSVENEEAVDEVYPLYNGSNLDFMKTYLSYSREDVLKNEITEREIFMNKYINTNFYGELSVNPEGEVFSCKNNESLGNIQTDSLKKIVLNEYCKHRNWFLTRNRMPGCKDCVYNWVCPPVTGNELAMDHWTFCEKP